LTRAWRWLMESDCSWLCNSYWSIIPLFTCSRRSTLFKSSASDWRHFSSWESRSWFFSIRVNFKSFKQLQPRFTSFNYDEFSVRLDYPWDKIVNCICLLISSDCFSCSTWSCKTEFYFSK
jgi:hypothetical protein